MFLTCCSHVAHVLLTCCSLVCHVWLTSSSRVIHMFPSCCSHVDHVSVTCLQETPPPVPKRRPYTVMGNMKMGFPQTRIMKYDYPGRPGFSDNQSVYRLIVRMSWLVSARYDSATCLLYSRLVTCPALIRDTWEFSRGPPIRVVESKLGLNPFTPKFK